MYITYRSGGRLGDFIHQLSVIHEIFLTTGYKGILYMYHENDSFTNGIEDSYNDLYDIVMNQEYIHSFTIYNNEDYNIDLSIWRYYLNNYIDLPTIYKKIFNTNFGKYKWLNNIQNLNEWNDIIVINTTHYRFIRDDIIQQLKNMDLCNVVFVSYIQFEYDYFVKKTNLNIKYYKPKSLMELTQIIYSCKYFIGSFSCPLSIATAIQKDCVYSSNFTTNDQFMTGWDKYMSFIRYSI